MGVSLIKKGPSTLNFSKKRGERFLAAFENCYDFKKSAKHIGITTREVNQWIKRSETWDKDKFGDNPFKVSVGDELVYFHDALELSYSGIAQLLESEGFRRAIHGHDDVVVSGGMVVMIPDVETGCMVPLIRKKHDNTLLYKMLAANNKKYSEQKVHKVEGEIDHNLKIKTGVLAIPVISNDAWGKSLAQHRKLVEKIDPGVMETITYDREGNLIEK